MTGLGLVWLVHAETGSYGEAGLVAGAAALGGALASPAVAALVDAYGQPRALPVLVAVHAACLLWFSSRHARDSRR